MIYTKIVDGKQIFSDCNVILTDDEIWISNPTEEMILENGWEPYVAPEVPITEPDLEMVMSAVKKMLSSSIENLSDEQALEIAALYPTWVSKIGQEVNVGERLWYNEKLYKVLQAHTVQEDWNPVDAVSLFTEVSIEEWPEIPEIISSENAWMAGDKGTWKGNHYICQLDNCVWNPDQYPAAWELK